MARQVGQLTALAVGRAVGRDKAYYISDGGGLSLQVTPSGAKSWIWRYRVGPKIREMGLGRFPDRSLAEARAKVTELRRQRLDGVDPIETRRAARTQTAPVTFRQSAEAYIAAHEVGWRNLKHRRQWRASINAYVLPILGDLPVAAIDTGLVMRVLDPIWTAKTETANRLRGRIEAVLDYAKARGWRGDGENPARWRGHIANMLPKRSRVRPVEHHVALDWRQMPAFTAGLRQHPWISAKALEFAILTAARVSEAVGATWAEVDLDNAVWAIPGARMKSGRTHRVPLSEPALAIVRQLYESRINDHVFPGQGTARSANRASLWKLIRRMGYPDVTVHGFRSAFADWGSETGQPRELIELSLAHTVGTAVERAYARSDLLDRRRVLMDAWGDYCEP